MVTAHQEQTKENDRRPTATLGRRQELNVQLNQLIDAVILVLCLSGAHTIRDYLGNFDGVAMIEPFKSYLWMVVIIMPFGPLLLDLQGFYHFPLQKTFLKSSTQIAQALLWLGVLIAGCSIFFRLNINSRSVLIFFAVFSLIALLFKERIVVLYVSPGLATASTGKRLSWQVPLRRSDTLRADSRWSNWRKSISSTKSISLTNPHLIW
jgi:hypothetical protein